MYLYTYVNMCIFLCTLHCTYSKETNVEIVKLARQHNDANAISLPARFISDKEALTIVNTFLNTSFEAGRHELRTKKINAK